MTPLPRFLPAAVVSAVLAASSAVVLYPQPLFAQDDPSAARADNGASGLKQNVEDFWHYAKIARYEAAVDALEKALASEQEGDQLLTAFEQVARERRDNLDEWLIRWQGVKELREPITKLFERLGEERTLRRLNPDVINEYISRLNQGARPFDIASGRLKDSGEIAVSIMVDWLRDENRKSHHSSIERALVRMGRTALNPLVAVTDAKNADLLISVVRVLGDLGYDAAVPYLVEIVQSGEQPDAVKQAATQALAKLGVNDPASVNAAESFYQLSEKLYYEKSSIVYDTRYPKAFVWTYDDTRGLTKKEVPHEIFNEVMAMRTAEDALRLAPDRAETVSLWLAANYKREAELPEGETDASRPENSPSADYFGKAAGTQYLDLALARAIRDQNSAVALRAIESLQKIVGQSNIFSAESQPLIDAMRYPDRRVRFEAAFTLAAALPDKSFNGQERVVPLLAEAVSQTGTPNVLVVLPNQDEANKLVDGLKGAGFGATGATSAEQAVAQALVLPSVDAIIAHEDLGGSEVNRLLTEMMRSPRLERVPRVIVTKTGASPYVQAAANDPLLHVTQATEADALKSVVDEARAKSGANPLDGELAASYALRSAELLERLAINRNGVLDLGSAQQALLGALDDERPDIVKAAGRVLGYFTSKESQTGLALRAAASDLSEEVRVSLYQSLANSAKFIGNQLEADQVEALQQVVESDPSLEVRSAAAEAHGALNLPAERIKQIIINPAGGNAQ